MIVINYQYLVDDWLEHLHFGKFHIFDVSKFSVGNHKDLDLHIQQKTIHMQITSTVSLNIVDMVNVLNIQCGSRMSKIYERESFFLCEKKIKMKW